MPQVSEMDLLWRLIMKKIILGSVLYLLPVTGRAQFVIVQSTYTTALTMNLTSYIKTTSLVVDQNGRIIGMSGDTYSLMKMLIDYIIKLQARLAAAGI